MNNLLKEIEIHHGHNATQLTQAFFTAAALPLPRRSDIFISTDSGCLIFMEEEACVIRLASPYLSTGVFYEDTDEIYDPIIDDDILQPIGSRKLATDLYLEIMPGVQCGCSEDEYRIMCDRLERKNYIANDFINTAFRNGGRLPDGTPIILDRGAVMKLRNAIYNVKAELQAQDRFFKPLRTIFENAWPERNTYPDALSCLWNKCREMKAQGILVAGWNNVDRGIATVFSQPAKAYSRYRREMAGPA